MHVEPRTFPLELRIQPWRRLIMEMRLLLERVLIFHGMLCGTGEAVNVPIGGILPPCSIEARGSDRTNVLHLVFNDTTSLIGNHYPSAS